MATNKRKDAAALFELIDKSTLKIPKDAKGALKIPAWFSSKTNPPPAPPPPPAAAPVALPEDDLPLEQPAQTSSPHPIPAALAPVGTHSPSIRPPQRVTTAPAQPPSTAPAQGTNASRVPVIVRGTTSTATPSTTPGGTRGTTVKNFSADSVPAAAALSPKRTNLRPPPQMPGPPRFSHPGMLARVPGWIFLAGGGGVIILVLLIALGLRGLSGNTPGTRNRGEDPLANGGVVIPPAPENDTHTAGRDPTNNPKPIPPGDRVAPPPTRVEPIIPGKVLPATGVPRAPNLYYLVIVSAPTAKVAGANAHFLVEHGMSDLTIEQNANGWFSVISVQGFGKLSDPQADALRKLVIEIGKQHPDFRRQHRSVYYDAYYRKVSRAAR